MASSCGDRKVPKAFVPKPSNAMILVAVSPSLFPGVDYGSSDLGTAWNLLDHRVLAGIIERSDSHKQLVILQSYSCVHILLSCDEELDKLLIGKRWECDSCMFPPTSPRSRGAGQAVDLGGRAENIVNFRLQILL